MTIEELSLYWRKKRKQNKELTGREMLQNSPSADIDNNLFVNKSKKKSFRKVLDW